MSVASQDSVSDQALIDVLGPDTMVRYVVSLWPVAPLHYTIVNIQLTWTEGGDHEKHALMTYKQHYTAIQQMSEMQSYI